jgi:hypothetical protein
MAPHPAWMLLLLLPLLLLADAASQNPKQSERIVVSNYPGQATELYKRWLTQPGALDDRSEKFQCIAMTFGEAPRDGSVFSQYGEDGIIEHIFKCIGDGGKSYVEFGTESGKQCETRRLREEEGWAGLLMDGSHRNDTINLHQELIFEENIVSLFQKHGAPQAPDLLVVDIDLNTFWVLAAIMRAGYTPRAVSVEYNRNFHPAHSYATTYMPGETWSNSCYFGASALAIERLMRHFGYSMVAFDDAGGWAPPSRDRMIGGK